MRFLTAAWIVLIALGSHAWGQPLADRVPEDAFLYIGWGGADTPGNGYSGSRLEAVVKGSNLKAGLADVISSLLERLGAEEPQTAQEVRDVLSIAAELGSAAWKHPTAIFVASGAEPLAPPRVGIACRAGADAETLLARVNSLIEKTQDHNIKLKAVADGDVVFVTLGYDQIPTQTRALAAKTEFAGAIGKVQQDPLLIFYLDVQSGVGALDRYIAAQNERELKDRWPKVREALGLGNFRRFVMTGRFDGKDWAEKLYADAPSPRMGLPLLFEAGPIDPGLMKLIPPTAGYASIKKFDLAALANLFRQIMAAADAQGAKGFDDAMAAAQQATGQHPITDILEPLGSHWVTFSDDSVAGNGAEGIVIVNKLDDAPKAKEALAGLWEAVSKVLEQAMRDSPLPLQLTRTKEGEIDLFTAESLQISPAWTIVDERLIIGFTADAVIKAATAKPPAGSFADNPKFTAALKRLNAPAVHGFEFTDLPVTAPQMLMQYEQAYGLAQMMAAPLNIDLPEKLVPSIDAIGPHLAPSLLVGWSDPGGFQSTYTSPFPGSEMLCNAPQGGMAAVGVSAMGIGIMLPSLNRDRETANRVKCASNERQIAMAILMYSQEHDGAYPPDLGTLVLTQDVTLDTFLCPNDDTQRPDNAAAMQPKELAEWVNAHSSYIFAGKGFNNKTTRADQVIVYEKPDLHGHDGINMCFGDGHVEFMRMPRAQEMIADIQRGAPKPK